MKQKNFLRFSILLFLLVYMGIQSAFCQPGTDIVFKNLSNGALLVRLKTYHNILKVYEGKDESRYNAIIAKRDRENQELIDAFESKWVLCPVYYFFNTESDLIKNKQFKGVLLDKFLKPVENIPDMENNYLIADLSYTKADTATYFLNTYLSTNDDVLKRKKQYGNEGSMGVEGLILLNQGFFPIQYPYPYFSKKYVLFVTRTDERMVEKLQAKILFYLKEESEK